MMIGVVIVERLPQVLNRPPLRPAISFGEVSEITVHPSAPMPLPKKAAQTRFAFLPERHTDFIFAVIGERYGFMGAGLVLSLYALMIWRALRILTISKNLYGALVAGGITAMLMAQVFVNVGGNLGIMPITGIPLPLMSYGGSSVVMTLIALGFLQSVHVQAREVASAKQGELAA